MSFLAEISSSHFAIDPASASFADRSIVGRLRLYGVSVNPRTDTHGGGAGVEASGTVRLYGLNSTSTASGSEIIFEFPVLVTGSYTQGSTTNFGKNDNYFVFDRGLYVDDNQISDGRPLTYSGLTLYYERG